MFGAPSYTFSEDGIVGMVEVVKVGVSTVDIVVSVTGGTVCIAIIVLFLTIELCEWRNVH